MRRYRDKDVKPRLQSQPMPVREAFSVPLLQPHYAKALDTVMIQGVCVEKPRSRAMERGPGSKNSSACINKKSNLAGCFS